MGRRGGGRERPTLRVESEGKSCPNPARGAARVARRRWREAAVAGGGGGSRVRPGLLLGLAARSPTPPDAPRPAARGLRRSPPCAAWARPDSETFSRESERATSGEDAGSTRPARGTRVHAAPLRRARGPARRRPPASEGRCPGRGRDAGPRPSRGRTPKADKQ